MNLKSQQYKQINNFLSKFKILQHSEGSTVIASQNNTFLIRHIEISNSYGKQKNQQLNQIINTLSQHQMFASKNILSLIDFQIIFNKDKTQSQIRAIYDYGQKTLSKQIQERRQTQLNFQQDALWGLLYSLATPLVYLQEKNVIYGVLDPNRVFLDKNISILDPSSTGIDPYQVTSNRLFSPELLKQQRQIQQIDMFKSDVFVLGMIMLQSALLKIEIYNYDQNVIQMCLSEIKDLYSQNFCQVIASMLEYQASERPSFTQIVSQMSDLFEISTSQIEILQPLYPDKQNECNQICFLDENSQKQNIDILQTQYIRYEEFNSASTKDYQKGKFNFFNPQSSKFNQSSINESISQSQNSSLFIQESTIKSLEKSKRVYKAKQIKDKLIKHQFIYQDQRQLHRQAQRYGHKRSKTMWNKVEKQDKTTETQINNTQAINYSRQKYEKSKQNISHNTNQNVGDFKFHLGSSQICKQNLFTKPEIMNMIKDDIKRIEERKKNVQVNFNYPPQNQNIKPCFASSQNKSQNQLNTKYFNNIKHKNNGVFNV